MNHRLEDLHPYPFERLGTLLEGVNPNPGLDAIALSLGEPKHAAPEFLLDAITDRTLVQKGFGAYPPTRGLPTLRQAIADFLMRRYHLADAPIDPETQVLPVNGTREGLFAVAQALINPEQPGLTLMPNPFYQIYEGAALLAGSRPEYLACTAANGFLPDFSQVEADTWAACELIYICSPGNPSGAVMGIEQMQALINLANEHDFVIVSDECYSEIYADEAAPPPGLLEAAAAMGQKDYRHCMVFNSLSKRSNLPGLRSGYVAGDADLMARFLLYRTYHGSAMSVHNQLLSSLAWQDEKHVIANRELYRQKYNAVMEVLTPVWAMERPAASFYLWPETPEPDTAFTRRLFEAMNIKVLPGSYLSRAAGGSNPGENRVRMALVATLEECLEAAERIRLFLARG